MASEARYPILAELGLEWPEDTPVDTVTATDTTQFGSVSGSHVVETGSLGARPEVIHPREVLTGLIKRNTAPIIV